MEDDLGPVIVLDENEGEPAAAIPIGRAAPESDPSPSSSHAMNDPQPDPGRNRTTLAVVLALVIAWALYLAFFGPKGPSPELQAPRLELTPAAKADYAWEGLVDLDGKPATLEAMRGKAIFLNIWATWCGPCREELPSIRVAAANPRLKDVAFVCVSTDSDAETLRRFVSEGEWPMTVLRTSALPGVFATDGIPASFLIAPDGRLVARHIGSAQWDDPKSIDALEALAKPRP